MSQALCAMRIDVLNELLEFVDSSYVVNNKLVKSGQRVVYQAKTKNNCGGRFVLKTSAIYPTSVARIQRELKILRELNSPYFPKPLYSKFISDEDIEYFIESLDPKSQPIKIEQIKSLRLKPLFITVEDFIDHIDWNSLQETFCKNEKLFITLLQKTFEALSLLWSNKIIHRDLKPDNILVNSNFHPTIIDLGIAKSLNEGTKNITSAFIGAPCTPQFAAPEQIHSSMGEVTYKSDQFSVGVISFWVMTGKYPFGCLDEIGPEKFRENIFKEPITRIRNYNCNVSTELEKFIYKLLSIQPYKRFRNYNAIKTSLNATGGS